MLTIHPRARATPAVRAEIACSHEPTAVLARRYGVSTETVRKWRKRGPADVADRGSRPTKLAWRCTEDERRIVCLIRRETRFGLDDLALVLRHFLPHLNRASIYRILKAEGLHRLADLPPLYDADRPRRGTGRFRDYDLGFVHLDVKHLPALRTADGEVGKRYLFVAIDRRSRFVHLAVRDDATQASAVAFLDEVIAACPFRVTHVLTDRGVSFKAVFAEACRARGVVPRTTRPYTPQTNGMAERFNGRIARDVLTVTVGSHAELETLLRGYNRAYNARPQKVLAGRRPIEVVRERLRAGSALANPAYRPPPGCDLLAAFARLETDDLSQPHT